MEEKKILPRAHTDMLTPLEWSGFFYDNIQKSHTEQNSVFHQAPLAVVQSSD